MKKCIVFGEEHFNSLGIIRSLGEGGIRPVAIILRGSKRITSASRYISDLHIVNGIEEGYQLMLEQYGDKKDKPYIFTSDDRTTSFLDQHYEELKDYFIFFNAGEKNRITYYMNKDNINRIAIRHGLNVLEAIPVKKGIVPKDIEYPIITKAIASTIGDWKKDVFVCHNDEELMEAYKHIRSETVLLQKYIVKKNELCLEAFSSNRGKNLFIAIASNYNYQLPQGYSYYMTVHNLKNPELENKLAGMIEEIGFEGIMEIEFLIGQDDQLYFCEVNFRNSTWSYAATVAGMNLPILWIKSMEEKSIPKNAYKEVKPGFTAIVEPNDFRVRVKSHMTGMITWIKEFMQSDCKYYLGRKDLGPIWSIVKDKIRKTK